jgi:hypothetical protein
VNTKATVKQDNKSTAIQTQSLGLSSDGMDVSDLKIPVAAIFQGTPKEQKAFPDAKMGQIIDKLSGQEMQSNRFVPIHVYKSWAKFVKVNGVTELEYIETDKSRVPAADLVWQETDEGNKPPAATETLNYYLMFEGATYPVIWRFKKTSLKAGQHMYSLESMLRSGQGKDVGLYEMGKIEKESSDGPYFVPDIRLIGDPPADLLRMALQFSGAIKSGKVVETGDEFSNDDIPV